MFSIASSNSVSKGGGSKGKALIEASLDNPSSVLRLRRPSIIIASVAPSSKLITIKEETIERKVVVDMFKKKRYYDLLRGTYFKGLIYNYTLLLLL